MNECFLLNKEVSTVIDKDYEIASRDNQTGKKTSVSLGYHAKWTNNIKKRNGEKKYFIIFLLMFYF